MSVAVRRFVFGPEQMLRLVRGGKDQGVLSFLGVRCQ